MGIRWSKHICIKRIWRNHHYSSVPSSCLVPCGLVRDPAVCTDFDTVPGIPYSSGVGRASRVFHYQSIVTSSVSDCNSLQTTSRVVLARSIHTDSKDIRRISVGVHSSCHVFAIRWYHNNETRALTKALLLLHRIVSRENIVGSELDENGKETADCKKQETWQEFWPILYDLFNSSLSVCKRGFCY